MFKRIYFYLLSAFVMTAVLSACGEKKQQQEGFGKGCHTGFEV